MLRTEREERLKIGICHGEGGNLQYEALVRMFNDNSIFDVAIPFVYGSHYKLMAAGKALGLHDVNPSVQNQIQDIKGRRMNVFLPQAESISEYTSLDTYDLLQMAVSHLRDGHIRAFISLPVCDDSIRQEHSDFKNQAMSVAQAFPGNPFRMLVCGETRLSFLTTVRREDSESYLSAERIEQRLRDMYHTLKSGFGITTPRIAVLGMNKDLNANRITLPGTQKIKPVVNALFESGMPVFGPFPAKSFFESKDRFAFDAVLCMYKEQMEMCLSNLPMSECCYYTASLPVIHIEPVFSNMDGDIVFSSLMKSVFLAIDIDANRQMFKKLNENPLKYSISGHSRRESKEEDSAEKLLSKEE